MELGASVAEALLAGAESAEVLSSLRDLVTVQVEVDAALTTGVLNVEVSSLTHDGG